MLSGNGRHRRPRQAPALIVAAGVTGSAIAIPLLGAGSASAADASTWDRVAECESGGAWSADFGNGFYGGLQFSKETWAAYGGTAYAPSADLASRSQQIAVAEKGARREGSARRGPPAVRSRGSSTTAPTPASTPASSPCRRTAGRRSPSRPRTPPARTRRPTPRTAGPPRTPPKGRTQARRTPRTAPSPPVTPVARRTPRTGPPPLRRLPVRTTAPRVRLLPTTRRAAAASTAARPRTTRQKRAIRKRAAKAVVTPHAVTVPAVTASTRQPAPTRTPFSPATTCATSPPRRTCPVDGRRSTRRTRRPSGPTPTSSFPVRASIWACCRASSRGVSRSYVRCVRVRQASLCCNWSKSAREFAHSAPHLRKRTCVGGRFGRFLPDVRL
ncbi:transglycosylase family protein [Streptomyces pristinaespiralis]|uniref:transglycosylase family protein n=1 Tax=Streptomyces pristinaespiralis TaxID=38300 RepID=UPI00131A2C4E